MTEVSHRDSGSAVCTVATARKLMLRNNEAVIFNYGSYSHPDFSLTQAAEDLKPMKANRPDASYQVKSLYVEYFKKDPGFVTGPAALSPSVSAGRPRRLTAQSLLPRTPVISQEPAKHDISHVGFLMDPAAPTLALPQNERSNDTIYQRTRRLLFSVQTRAKPRRRGSDS